MLIIRKFREEDAVPVSDLIIRTLLVTNSGDYPPYMIEELILREQPEDQTALGRRAHFYVAEAEGSIVGCGAVEPAKNPGEPCGICSIFVLPEFQGKGIGRKIMETLERDGYAAASGRVGLHASITGLGFYKKLGYETENGCEGPDENLLFTLTKRVFPKSAG